MAAALCRGPGTRRLEPAVAKPPRTRRSERVDFSPPRRAGNLGQPLWRLWASAADGGAQPRGNLVSLARTNQLAFACRGQFVAGLGGLRESPTSGAEGNSRLAPSPALVVFLQLGSSLAQRGNRRLC